MAAFGCVSSSVFGLVFGASTGMSTGRAPSRKIIGGAPGILLGVGFIWEAISASCDLDKSTSSLIFEMVIRLSVAYRATQQGRIPLAGFFLEDKIRTQLTEFWDESNKVLEDNPEPIRVHLDSPEVLDVVEALRHKCRKWPNTREPRLNVPKLQP